MITMIKWIMMLTLTVFSSVVSAQETITFNTLEETIGYALYKNKYFLQKSLEENLALRFLLLLVIVTNTQLV